MITPQAWQQGSRSPEQRRELGCSLGPSGGVCEGDAGPVDLETEPNVCLEGASSWNLAFPVHLFASTWLWRVCSVCWAQPGREDQKVELGHTEEVSPCGCEVGLEMSSYDVTGQD